MERLDDAEVQQRFNLMLATSDMRFDAARRDAPLTRKDVPTMKLDAYGRVIPGSIQIAGGGELRADESAAYRRSVERIGASHADMRMRASGERPEPVDPEVARLERIKDKKHEAFVNNAEARAEEAYQRSVDRLNASRPTKHPSGRPIDPASVR